MKAYKRKQTSPTTATAESAAAPTDDATLGRTVSLPRTHMKVLHTMMLAQRRFRVSDVMRLLVEDKAVAEGLGEMVGGTFVPKGK